MTLLPTTETPESREGRQGGAYDGDLEVADAILDKALSVTLAQLAKCQVKGVGS